MALTAIYSMYNNKIRSVPMEISNVPLPPAPPLPAIPPYYPSTASPQTHHCV